MRTLTYAITHSPVFARSLPEQHSPEDFEHGLLDGTAAQDAFVALFDQVDDFDFMAREAAQAPIPRESPPRRRAERVRELDSVMRGPRTRPQTWGDRPSGTPSDNRPQAHGRR